MLTRQLFAEHSEHVRRITPNADSQKLEYIEHSDDAVVLHKGVVGVMTVPPSENSDRYRIGLEQMQIGLNIYKYLKDCRHELQRIIESDDVQPLLSPRNAFDNDPHTIREATRLLDSAFWYTTQQRQELARIGTGRSDDADEADEASVVDDIDDGSSVYNVEASGDGIASNVLRMASEASRAAQGREGYDLLSSLHPSMVETFGEIVDPPQFASSWYFDH
jgi:hypothetical protein